jgi:hypothetical protein
MTLAVCTYLFKCDRLSLSSAIALCVWSCFIISVTFAMQPCIVHKKCLLPGQTVNHAFIKGDLERLRKRAQRVRKDIAGNWVLHHDNAPAHTTVSIREFLAKKNIPTLPHPPYNPDLASCCFYLFLKLKSKLKGQLL